ncbi:MAG: PKD domain-containing protein [Candidatus Cloacimonetes bacterium]|nr:PKD domain-containing protein [Candidatus Cloacimonadota bacterium]
MKQNIFIFVFLILSTFLAAAIINVPVDQPTIQAGINIAVDTDTVLVQPGTYLENINYNGKLITVASLFLTTQDTTYISSTTIDGNSSDRVVIFVNGEDSTTVLCGFTISNGSASFGGGIYCSYSSSPSLENLTITGNTATTGGGIFCDNYSSPSLQNLTITGNTATTGGGIFCDNYSSPSLQNVAISGNSASGDYADGGGIYCLYNSNPSLVNVTISGNSATDSGGGIYCYQSGPSLQNVTISSNSATGAGGGIFCITYSSPSLQNVTISGNSANFGGGIFCGTYSSPSLQNVTISGNSATTNGGGISSFDSNLILINSILWNDLPQEIYISSSSITATYSDIEGGWTGTGNIDSDPLFVDPGSGDYHLQSISPCVDAGDPASPLDPDGTIADMGAYFFPQFIIADFTADTTNGYFPLMVNFTDLSTQGTGVIDEWYWEFGDGNNSSLQNPANEYLLPGIYTVSLTVTDVYDFTDTETKVDYITVYSPAYSGPVWHISTTGSDITGNGSTQYPFATIQHGINASSNTDTVLVQPGTYVENINYNGKLITVGSLFLTTQNTTYISSTTIDGNSGGSVVIFESGEDSTAVLCGFTITNGSAVYGGGIFCDGSSPNLENVTITNNSTSGTYGFGGGIYCFSSSPSLENVTITGNSATSYGGGIYCDDSSPVLINSILWNDSPQEIYIQSGSVTTTYSDIQGGWAGTGNIDSDPLFVDPGIGDYNLQSTSPCIDAGDPTSPLDPDGTIADMGAYYYDQILNPIPPIADFTVDISNGYFPLTVNFTDLSTQGTGVIDEWYWEFGDGNNSSLQNPANEYLLPGIYTVSLTVTDVIDSTDTETKVDYITVYSPAYSGPVWHISTTGSDITGNGSTQYPFATIQHGINTSSNTDTVLVQPGTYVENINYNGKLIAVGSLFLTTQDTTYISSTIIDGNSNGSVIIYNNGEDSTAVLCGFAIIDGSTAFNGGGIFCYGYSSPSLQNIAITGNSASSKGGGIYCELGSSPSLQNVTISGNSATDSGGGIYCELGSSPSLQNVTISGNSASIDGGGIYFRAYSSPSLENVTITGNTATDSGGGIYCDLSSNPSLVNVTIAGNTASDYGGGIICEESSPSLENVTITDNYANNGGGIFCWENSSPSLENVAISDNFASLNGGGILCSGSSSNPSLVNVTITGNTASYGGGIWYLYSSPSLENVTITGNTATSDGGGIYFYGSSLSLINSILWNDSPQEIYIGSGSVTATYSDIEGGFTGTGNIDSDPLFVDPGIGDYHLQSNSPCIDAGDPASPLDPDGTIADMGAYYFHQVGIPPTAEFTSDIIQGYSPLTINFTDLSNHGSVAITEWLWDFGDGNNSSLQNPTNEYYNRGYYTISLTVTDVNNSTDTETKIDYITVLNSTPFVQNPITDFSFDEDTSNTSIDLNNVFDDADLPYGDVLSFSYSGNTYIDVSIVSGIVTLTPDPDWFGYEDITFTATDDSLASINDEVRITIDPVNDAPVINSYYPSYSPVTIDETESQLFWVSASDIDCDPLSYQWYVDDVPQTGQTDSTYTQTTDYTSAGTYMIKCIVDDGVAERTVGFSRVDKANNINLDSEDNRATDFQEWQLIVNDVDQEIVVNDIQPPTGDVTINELETINFFIDAYDPDGNPLEYSWKLDGVEESTTSTYDFITDYTSAGNYLVTLDMTDNFTDNLLYYEWNVIVNDIDQEIIVNDIQPTPGPVTINETETINFFIDAYDPDGNPLEYSWKLNGFEESTTSTYDFTTDYTSAGNYLVTLDVTDNFTDRSDNSRNELNYSWTVMVNDVDQEIVVNDIQPAPGPVTINETETINFFIDAYDPDGNPLEYSWKLDGVEESTTSTYDFTTDYASAGEYVVTLEVTDNFGTRRIIGRTSRNTLNYSWDVTVNNVDQPIVVNELIPPEGDITIDEGDVINFSIDAYDPDGNDLEYSWLVEGVEVSVVSTFDFITDENSAGEYEVTLFVTDNFGTRNELNFLWDIIVNDVSGSSEIVIPSISMLYQNHPNPFNPKTNIQFDIKNNESGILTIFNIKGQIVASQRFNSGRHNYLWNAANCSSGIYLYKLQTANIIETKKMLLLK